MGNIRNEIQIVTNRAGSFAMLSPFPISKYSGVFIRLGNELFKIIDCLIGAEGTFYMPHGLSSVMYEHTNTGHVGLMLDICRMYDFREWGRQYSVLKKRSCVLISFTKKSDSREDLAGGVEEFSMHIAIRGIDLSFTPNESWEKHSYNLDIERKSPPTERYVFNAGAIDGQKIVFSIAKTKQKAMQESKYVLDNFDLLKVAKDKAVSRAIKSVQKNKHIPHKVANAYECAANSLAGMLTTIGKETGVYAGLPWFYQFWARDEGFCIKALDIIGYRKLAKQLSFQIAENISEYGDIVSVSGGLHSADALGIAYFRASQLNLTREEKRRIAASLKTCIERLLSFRTSGEGLALNNPLETWMDTSDGDDTRQGARIEIQALRLAMYNYMYQLTGNKEYHAIELLLKKKVRSIFLNNKYLYDGADDPTIRPNMFIAAYVYPKLLTRREWVACFSTVLPRLWCGWGGIASIDRKSPLFCSEYTGQGNKSYHRGDSWFFLNNMAAIVLYQADKRKFKKYIDKIVEASTTEILYMGATGYHAEISSALHLSSKGCLAQSWSASLYIEMINVIYLRKSKS